MIYWTGSAPYAMEQTVIVNEHKNLFKNKSSIPLASDDSLNQFAASGTNGCLCFVLALMSKTADFSSLKINLSEK